MKFIAVLAALVLVCAFVHSAEVASDSEIDATLTEMVSLESTQAVVASLQAQAKQATSAAGISRLVELLRKVLQRLRKQSKLGAKRFKKAQKVCKQSVSSARATIIVARDELKIAKVKFEMNTNTIKKSKNDAALHNENIGKATAKAASYDNQIVVGRNDLTVNVNRLTQSNKETEALVKMLREIDSKLTSNGLAEVAAQMTAAAKGRAAEQASMMLAIAAKAESGSDTSDVHDMIQLLIKALLTDMQNNSNEIVTRQGNFAKLQKSMIDSANAERANIKSVTKTRDSVIAAGDAAQKANLALQVQITAQTNTKKAAKARLVVLAKNCKSSKNAWATKRVSFMRQIRVIKQIIKQLTNTKMSASTLAKIANVNLNYPVWKVSAWSACSKECGMGTKTRAVSCSGAKCIGNKPRASASCTQGACQEDCIVSRWTAFSDCSQKCGGGVKSKTRKILAQAAAGGKACPAPAGLKVTVACNTKACPSKVKKARNGKGANIKKVRAFKRAARRLTKKMRMTRKRINKLKKVAKKFVNALKNKTYKNQQQWLEIINKLKKIGNKIDNLKLKVGSIKVNKFVAVQKGWQFTKRGIKAMAACLKAGFKQGSAALQACLQDARMMGDLKKAINAAKRTNKAAKKAKKTNAKPCVVSAFGKWSACSSRCGGGVSTRTRIVRLPAENGGKTCPGLQESVKCNLQPCPVDCKMTEWTAWSACTKSCAGGTQFQTRSIQTKSANGGASCPTTTRQQRACNTQACPPPPRPKESVSNDCLPGNCPNPPPMRRNVDGAPGRSATHNGDPHLTNYNGDFFHPQTNGIYTATATKDGLFEVQWHQDGFTNHHGTGGYSIVQSCKIRYKGNVYDNNFGQDGFSVSCGYGWWSINMPGNYQGQTAGVCGENRASWGGWNFQNKAGDNVDVQWNGGGGAQVWGLAGYAGTGSKLGRWFVSWKPAMDKCMYGSDRCRQNLANQERALNSGCNFCSAWGCFSACGSM